MTNEKNTTTLPKGYKQTKIGVLPVEWEVKKLKEITLRVQDGTHFSPQEIGNGSFKYITSKNIRPGYLKLDTVEYISLEEHQKIYSRCDTKLGDILLTKDGASTGAACLNTLDEEVSLLSSVAFIRADPNKAENKFLYQFICSPRGQNTITSSMAGQAITRITLTKLRNFDIPLPPLPQQQKIAKILATWDQAIQTQTQLINAKKELKRGLMQRLLTGEVRLPGFEGEWKATRLAEVLTESQIEGTNGLTAEKITVKLWGKGVFRKIDRNPGSKNTNYFLRKAGQLIYSKLDFLNCAFGIIPPELDNLESTLDLPTFDIHNGADPVFLLERIKLRNFYENFGSRANGSRIARRIHPKMFLSFKVNLPPFQEQTAIAKILITADKELTLLQTQLTELKEQKRGLMQRLLTGAVRVTVPATA
jgi:type I restriction enzyme S subunit